ncbi:P-selectin-like, partial [Tetranychus urticae]
MCTDGTVPSGPNELTCLPQGNWDNPVPLCVLRSCPDIGSIENGVTRGDCSPGVPGRLCSFACDNGYSLQNGPNVIECYPNGTWSGSPPSCLQITCEPLAQPSPNGGLQGSCNPGYIGEQCIFTCPPGYRLIGATNALCQQNGTWSAVPPFCILATCPSLTSPICGYAYGTCSPGALGESCTFACAQGCYLDGAEVLTCLENGRWS